MHRTRLSPRCCATSSVSVLASSSNVTSACNALNSSGTAPRGNSTSTTGPVTRTTRPLVSFFVALSVFSAVAVISIFFLMGLTSGGVGQCVGTADDFADFLGDVGLALAVGHQGQLFDEVVGVVGGRLHRALT